MRRRRQQSFAISAPAPFSELNTTPLIDVMLVLLIMFIITIPITTHKVAVDLPQGGEVAFEPMVHRLDLDAGGGISWDGLPIPESALAARLRAFEARPDAELHFRADGEARYEDYDRILATVKRAGVAQLGLVGNDRFAEGMF